MGLFNIVVADTCPKCKKMVFYGPENTKQCCPECGMILPKVNGVSMSKKKWDKMDSESQNAFLKKALEKIEKSGWKNLVAINGEYRKKCNVCSKIWCFTEEDRQENQRNRFLGVVNGLSSVTNTLGGGSLLYSQGANAAAERATDRIVDYDKCPYCGSKDIRDLDESEWAAEQAKAAQGSTPAPAVSAADELKKFKDLLDGGVITQEEFDAKKKQLLGL